MNYNEYTLLYPYVTPESPGFSLRLPYGCSEENVSDVFPWLLVGPQSILSGTFTKNSKFKAWDTKFPNDRSQTMQLYIPKVIRDLMGDVKYAIPTT